MIVFKLLGPRETSSPGSLELRKCSNMSLLRQPSILENTGDKYIEKILIGEFHNKENEKEEEESMRARTNRVCIMLRLLFML